MNSEFFLFMERSRSRTHRTVRILCFVLYIPASRIRAHKTRSFRRRRRLQHTRRDLRQKNRSRLAVCAVEIASVLCVRERANERSVLSSNREKTETSVCYTQVWCVVMWFRAAYTSYNTHGSSYLCVCRRVSRQNLGW